MKNWRTKKIKTDSCGLITAEEMIKEIKHCPRAFSWIELKELIELKEFLLEAVKANSNMLADLLDDDRKKYIDEEIAFEAVKNNGYSIKFIPYDLRTRELYLEVVKENGMLLGDMIPYKYMDYEICYNAVVSRGLAIQFVPDELKTREVCVIATSLAENNISYGYIPERYLDREFYLDCVKRSGKVLRIVPEEYMDYEMCYTAVRNCGEALCYITEDDRDYKLCKTAVDNNLCALLSVPKKIFDKYFTNCKIYRTSDAKLYVRQKENGEYEFTVDFYHQKKLFYNKSKDELIYNIKHYDRFYGNYEENILKNDPYRQEYLDILEQY